MKWEMLKQVYLNLSQKKEFGYFISEITGKGEIDN